MGVIVHFACGKKVCVLKYMNKLKTRFVCLNIHESWKFQGTLKFSSHVFDRMIKECKWIGKFNCANCCCQSDCVVGMEKFIKWFTCYFSTSAASAQSEAILRTQNPTKFLSGDLSKWKLMYVRWNSLTHIFRTELLCCCSHHHHRLRAHQKNSTLISSPQPTLNINIILVSSPNEYHVRNYITKTA